TVIVGSENRIIPDSVKLADVEGTCSLVINSMPLARNRCTGARIKGESKDPLNYNTAGDYTIHWVYADAYDTVVQEQKIRVKTRDSLIPEVAALPNLEGNCEVRVTRFPTAVNNCTGKVITATTNSSLVVSTPGINLIHWIFKDGSASLTQVQMVTVSQRSVSLKVYPNPTHDEFRILAESCSPDSKLSLKVYDILGRLVEARNALDFNKEIRFGSGYPGSTYFAQVLWGDKQYMYKLIKCK
ncbi:MAG TPA: T9SS type A sorting domain-containing protein, partial [Flavitalea sp.]|nr:T9SS type A sorting domain-containing protein [Flavitalea sp.]